jgi:hypothetical protein
VTQAIIGTSPCQFPHSGHLADRVELLPDGAISIEAEGGQWVLRASEKLQARFEQLLQRRKAGTLDQVESREYEAICDLDTALSWLNRLARNAQGL